MLICIVCGKVIANSDPNKVRYGGCSVCPLLEVAKKMREKDFSLSHFNWFGNEANEVQSKNS